MKSLCIINVIGLTPALVSHEATPLLARLAGRHGARPLRSVIPAVTCSAQASLLTGLAPSLHGIVANGWLYRDTMEARLWQQSRALMQGETIYEAARKRAAAAGEKFTCAKLFWWFNQGAKVDWSLTPKPWYGCDGDKRFGILGTPAGFAETITASLGAFPFHTFWGPESGAGCTRWIAQAAEKVLRENKPTLTLVYLPHLDYDFQRFGVTGAHVKKCLQEVDACAGRVIAAAQENGAEIIALSEYGLANVNQPVHINRVLRQNGLLTVRGGPFGEMIDLPETPAFALADHQLAHIYVKKTEDVASVRKLLAEHDGIAEVWGAEEKAAHGLDHPRSGELVALAAPGAWFTYYYWFENASAPDFARTVDIHRKPGYDPCELFYDPALAAPRLYCAWKILQKKLGMRVKLDVVPLDASLVKGSHGLPPASPEEGAVFITSAAEPRGDFSMLDVKDYALRVMFD
jgi:predicted AlkP superfamily pyrophosphatase or phosphodiesterase